MRDLAPHYQQVIRSFLDMRTRSICWPCTCGRAHSRRRIRSRFYQRLVIAGYSHRAVTLLDLGLAVLGAVLEVLWTVAVPGSDFAVAVLPPVCAFLLWRGMVRVEARTSPRG